MVGSKKREKISCSVMDSPFKRVLWGFGMLFVSIAEKKLYYLYFFFLIWWCSSGHRLNLVQRHSRTDTAKYAFSSRVVPHWNSLPGELKDINTLYSFKKGLDKHLKSLWDTDKHYQYIYHIYLFSLEIDIHRSASYTPNRVLWCHYKHKHSEM